MTIQFPDKLQCLFTPSRYKVLYGGRGGGKSQNIARALLIQGTQARHKIICTREIQKSIQDSVHALLEQEIAEMGLRDFYEVQKQTILSRRNGTEFLFAGLRSNIASIKSIPKLTRGWVEEAQSASATNIKTLAYTIREPDSELWLSFNPELEDDPVYQDYVADPPQESIVVKIGWQDNPWFPEVLRKEKDEMRQKKPAEYENVWEGKCKAAVEGAIFAKELALATEEQRITRVPVKAGIPVNTYWDLGQSDSTAIWFIQIVGMEYRVVDYYQASGEKMPHYIAELAKRDYMYGEHCLPHDADHEQMAAKATIRQQLQEAISANTALGKTVRIVERIAKKALGIDAARSIFGQCLFDKEKTGDGLQCLRRYAFDKDIETGKVSKEPKHDIWSHGADAFLCFAQHFKRTVIRPPKQTFQQPTSFWAQ